MLSKETKRNWRIQVETIQEAYNLCLIELNNWEIEFLDSIEIQLHNKKDLSFKQSSILRKIYDKIQ